MRAVFSIVYSAKNENKFSQQENEGMRMRIIEFSSNITCNMYYVRTFTKELTVKFECAVLNKVNGDLHALTCNEFFWAMMHSSHDSTPKRLLLIDISDGVSLLLRNHLGRQPENKWYPDRSCARFTHDLLKCAKLYQLAENSVYEGRCMDLNWPRRKSSYMIWIEAERREADKPSEISTCSYGCLWVTYEWIQHLNMHI